MIGLDYASVAGNESPDLRSAKKSGVTFVIQRGAFGAYNKYKKTYSYLPDPHLKRDWAKLNKAPVVRGVYMMPEPRASLITPEEQVAVFSAAVEEAGGLRPGDLPPILDVEFPGGIGRGESSAVKTRLRRAALSWMAETAHLLHDTYDVWPMIYTSARVWDGDDEDTLNADTMKELVSDLVECPLWLARYPKGYYNSKAKLIPPSGKPPVPEMWGVDNFWIWQYHGNASNAPGFSGLVDVNKFFAMKTGEKGARVQWLQRRLRIETDGIYGPQTAKAVSDYQKLKGLKVDGVVGIGTFAQLAWET